jgi:hypothetical protein
MNGIVRRMQAEEIRQLSLPGMLLVFVVGLLVGWLAIGWWLWPVDWTDADPWDLRTEHQERYLALLAKDFAQTMHADRAREAVAGWDSRNLSDLLATMRDEAGDPEMSRLFADLIAVVGIPDGESASQVEPDPSAAMPSLGNRLVTVCGTAVVVLAAAVLIIFAASTRLWESFARGAQRVLPTQTMPSEEAEAISSGFTTMYTRDQNDYAEYFPIRAPNGQFLGECGVKSIGGISGQGSPQPVTALEMVLLDSKDHVTETRILMSRHAYRHTPLRRELMTRGELILAEEGVEVLVETGNIKMSAIVSDVEYAEEEPVDGVFLRVVVDLDVEMKDIPEELVVGEAEADGDETE